MSAVGCETVISKDFHDRFIIIDETTAYHLGASLKDLGKQCFAISLIEEPGLLVALLGSRKQEQCSQNFSLFLLIITLIMQKLLSLPLLSS